MFESEASTFQSAGIQVGADQREAEERLLSDALAPFGVTRRNTALEMARLYAVIHCFENELRGTRISSVNSFERKFKTIVGSM